MLDVLLYIASVLIWGSTWYVIDFQLGVVDPGVSLAYRNAIAAVIAFAWCLLARKSLSFNLRTHAYFVLLGTFLFGLNYLSAYEAQFYISSALNAIGFSSLVWMNILSARLFFGRQIGSRTYIGAALGIAGILIIFLPEVQVVSLSDRFLVGLFFSLLGTVLASVGNSASAAVQLKGVGVMQANAWGMLYGALINALLALSRGKAFVFDPSPEYLYSLLFLAAIGSVAAFACYLTLLGRIGLERAGYATVMIPVVALGVSAIFEELSISLGMLAGLALAVVGNVFILVRKQSAR